jgi:hypothetical protein
MFDPIQQGFEDRVQTFLVVETPPFAAFAAPLPLHFSTEPVEVAPEALDFLPDPVRRPVMPVPVRHQYLHRRLKWRGSTADIAIGT